MPDAEREQACPACGKPVDPLRAGEVAFLGGGFFYFCNRGCKADYVSSLPQSVVRDDVATAEPAPVVPKSEPVLRASSHPPEDSVSEVIERPPPYDPEPGPPPPSLADIEAPRSVREEASAPSSGPVVLSALAAAAGLLVLGMPLLGSDALGVRVPVGVAALALALAREWISARMRPREGWVGAVALAGAAVALGLSHGAQSSAIASFAGLAAVASVATREVLDRAREPVIAARARIAQRMRLTARVIEGTKTRTVSTEEARAGEQVLVEAGETLGVDGVVGGGDALVVPWPDAPIEMAKREGDAVAAGASVVRGSLRVTVTWSGAERAFSRLALSPTACVDVAAPLPRLAHAIATRAAPLVGVLAGVAAFANNAPLPLAICVASAALFGFSAEAASGAVALALAHAHLRAQRSGIVYKDAVAFDRAGGVDVAVACARGTLLLGEPEIVLVEGFAAWDSARVLGIAAALASGATHPFALAILRAARARGAKPEGVRNTVHNGGAGATALDAMGARVVLGRRAFLVSERVGVAAVDSRVSDLEAQGRSALLLASGGKVVGLVGLQDGLRVGARAAVQRLLDARIEPVMLSGESRETCETIARSLDIDHIRPEVLAADRGAEVRALAEGGNVVAVLGHAATDDAALGSADVSVTLAAAGGAPGEWTVALASDDVRDAVSALTIPRDARERGRRALLIGLAPGLVSALALALGVAPLAIAAVAAIVGATGSILYARE